MNFKKVIQVLFFVFIFVVTTSTLEAATSTSTEQKIEVLSPSGKGGETLFKRGEKIPYSYTLKKNSKKLVVSLYGGSKDDTVYEAKKYDGWGTSTKVIAAKDTVKLMPGSYGLLICDYTENKNDPVCDSSDGVITITDDAALEVATSTPKDQKIEIKSPNGGEQFYKGESINYNYKLAKNSKNLLVELVEADKNTVAYSVKRYDGWGDNRKVISKEDTKKIPSGMYILRICDTSTKAPVCDVSNGRITIVDKLPTSQISTLTAYSLKILSPNGGERLINGQKTKIKWESNLPADQELELYLSFGQLSMGKYIATVKNSNKNYNWTVKSFDSLISEEVTPPKTYYSDGTFRISIVCPNTDSDCMKPGNNETNYFDYSDSPFTIKSVNASTTDPDPSDGTYGDTQGNETRTEETRIINGAPTDACKNLPGDQAGIPSGYTNTGVKVSGNCKKVGAKDEFSEPVKEEGKNQEQKIVKICQVATRKTVDNEEKVTWKDVKCEGDAYKNAIKKNKRMIDRPVEKGTQSAFETSYPTMIELESGATHEFVKAIQKYLNSNGYMVNEKEGEPGSKGYESDYFGEKTKQALIKFQKDKGITPAQGYFGPKTRAAMGI